MTKIKSPLTLLACIIVLASSLIHGCKQKEPAGGGDRLAAIEAADKDLRASYGKAVEHLLFRQGVQHALASAGVKDLLHGHISHDAYETLDRSWVAGPYSVELNRVLFDAGVVYRGGALNCEDFSLGATFIAKAYHLRMAGRTKDASPAFGFLYYKPENPDVAKLAHAINFAILKDGSVMFYEPQSRMEVRLTEAEIGSVYFWEL